MQRTVLVTMAVVLGLLVLPAAAHGDAQMCSHLKSFIKNKSKFTATVANRKISFQNIQAKHKKIFGHVASTLQNKLKKLDKIKKLYVVIKKVVGCGKTASTCPGRGVVRAGTKDKDKDISSVTIRLPGGGKITIVTETTWDWS